MTKNFYLRNWKIYGCCIVVCLLLLLSTTVINSRTNTFVIQPHTIEIGDIPYISLKDLAKALNGRLNQDLAKQKITLRAGNHTFVFTLLSSVIVINDVAFRMPVETKLYNRVPYVPKHPFLLFLERKGLIPSDRLPGPHVNTYPLKPNILGLQILSDKEETKLILETDGTLSRDRVIRKNLEKDRLNLLIKGGELGPRTYTIPRKKGYIQELSVVQNKEDVQIDLRYDNKALWRHLKVEKRKIILSFKPILRPSPHSELFGLRTVIIDPGHGGFDPGAVGPNGTKEKEITLKVAKQLKRILERQLKVNVILTRKNDSFVTLQKRAQTAIKNNGKLFISLHCNASINPKTTGWEVYFLSDAKTDEAAEVAKRENAVLLMETKQPKNQQDRLNAQLLDISFGLRSTQFLKESQELCGLIHFEVVQTVVTHAENRGVKQANFHVMRGTLGAMPSILVEMGFISNSKEEKRLRSTAFQKRMAKAIYRGIKTFKHHYEQPLSANR